jgi:predicted anti-sigma-YlaC factor YlaD
MNPCSHFQDQLFDFVDGHLPQADRWRMESHLAECSSCRSRLAEERWLSGLLHGALAQSPLKPLSLWPSRTAVRRPRWRRPALAAAALMALAIGLTFWRSSAVPSHEVIATGPIATGLMARGPIATTQSDAQQLADLQAAIEREASAAELAMSAELLAAEPAADQYATEALRFVAETFPETSAGRDAARRVGLDPHNLQESL